LTQHSTGSQLDTLRRLNEAAGADGVRRAMRLMEANFGKAKKTPEDEEIWLQLWVAALGKFDLETLKRQAIAACHKFKFWPSLAEFRALCVEDRKDLADRAGVNLNPKPKFEGPPEDPRAIREREETLALNRKVRELLAEAQEPPIDWKKNHKAEFDRVEPFRERARKELGYV
jgi:hypothetical protein